MTKRIKIISDGTIAGTKVMYNGTPIGTINALRIDFNATHDLARCRMEVMVPELEIELPDESIEIRSNSIKKCPICGKPSKSGVSYLTSEETPMLEYSCADCSWSESICMPLEFYIPGQDTTKGE